MLRLYKRVGNIQKRNSDTLLEIEPTEQESKKTKISRDEILEKINALVPDDKSKLTELVKQLYHTVDDTNKDDTITNGMTILHMAAYLGEKQLVQDLIEIKQVDIAKESEKGNSVIGLAASSDSLETVTYMVECTKKILDVKHTDFLTELDGSGWNAMHYAASNGKVGIMDELVNQQGLHILNLEDKERQRPVYHAVCGGHLDAIKRIARSNLMTFISNNQNIFGLNPERYQAVIDMAVSKEHSQVTDYLKTLPGYDTCFQPTQK